MHTIDTDSLKIRIETAAHSDIESGRVGGIATAVMQNGKLCYQGCFGDERLGIQVSEHTLFRMASMTKPITAIAVLMLIDQGKFALDTPVSDILPEFGQMYVGEIQDGKVKRLKLADSPLTVRNLLTHSSGLGGGEIDHYLNHTFPHAKRISIECVVQRLAQMPLDYEPNTAWAYSALHAFDVLARIVEITSEIPYGSFLKQNIFDPLEMHDTTFSPTEKQWAKMIPMHTYEDGIGKIINMPPNNVYEEIPTTCCCAGAGLASTLHDYKKFANMLLNGGMANGTRFISPRQFAEFAAPQLSLSIMDNHIRGEKMPYQSWGLSVRVVTDAAYGTLPCGSFGWSGAYGTHFWVDPQNQIVAIYLKNSCYPGETASRFEQAVYSSLNCITQKDY